MCAPRPTRRTPATPSRPPKTSPPATPHRRHTRQRSKPRSVSDLSLFGAFLHDAALPAGWQPWMDHVLTGVFIGGGSAPVHTLIRFISDRKTTAEAAELAVEETPEEKAPPSVRAAAIAVEASPDTAAGAFIDIPYQGGVDAMLLQSVHRRTKNPELVV